MMYPKQQQLRVSIQLPRNRGIFPNRRASPLHVRWDLWLYFALQQSLVSCSLVMEILPGKNGRNMGETHGKHGKSRWKDKTWLKLGIWAGNAVVLPCFTSKQMGIWRVHQQEMGWMIAHQAVMRLEEFWSNGHGASHPSVTLGYYESIMVI